MAVALKQASRVTVAIFIHNNPICCFAIPNRLLFDYGTPFVNTYEWQLYEEYGIDHVKSSHFYPQGNIQAEATNLYCEPFVEWSTMSLSGGRVPFFRSMRLSYLEAYFH